MMKERGKRAGIKKNRLLKELVRRLEPYQPEKVFLFGSYARDENDDLSDIDLAIIKPTGEDFFQRIRSVMRILDYRGSLDVLVYTPEEFRDMQESGNAFVHTIIEEGVVLYEQVR